MRNFLILLCLVVTVITCQDKQSNQSAIEAKKEISPEDTLENSSAADIPIKQKADTIPFSSLLDSAFIAPAAYQLNYKLQISYATTANFTGKVLYDCANCLLRKVVADALAQAAIAFKNKGLGILLFDCYRPLSVQQKMWELVPNPIYVADPSKGSMHNRGNAVDMSLYRLDNGNPLDMGTNFDHFGKEAHHAFTDLPEQVLINRKLLKETMEKAGFKSITSEWWHYSYNNSVFPISDFPVPCN